MLGYGSILPTAQHFATSQVVDLCDELLMTDCGEGARMQSRKPRSKFSRLNHIFISHLHDDHCSGLMGLISTFGLLGRTAESHTHSPKGLEELLAPTLSFFCHTLAYKVIFHEFDTRQASVTYGDRSMTVTTILLQYRIPCHGFLFAEKTRPNHIIRNMIDFYKVPVYELDRIRNGADYITPEEEVTANAYLTRPSDPPRRYAYCSDMVFQREIAEQILGVDLFFHEATFVESGLACAKETYHITTAQAGRIAVETSIRRLVTGHFSARYENGNVLLKEASTILPDTILAKENLCIGL